MHWDEVFANVGAIAAAGAVTDIAAVADKAARDIGFCSVGYTYLGETGLGKAGETPPDIPVYFSTHAPGWADAYCSAGLWRDDPVLAAVGTRLRPFRPLQEDFGVLNARARDALYSLAAFGLTDEIATPIRGGRAGDGLMSFACDGADLFDDRAFAMLEPRVALIAGAVHARMSSLVAGDVPQDALTPAQRECLRWAALGKTSGEAAVILGVNDVTVRRHNMAAMKRLGAVTVAQAVAQALTRKLIAL